MNRTNQKPLHKKHLLKNTGWVLGTAAVLGILIVLRQPGETPAIPKQNYANKERPMAIADTPSSGAATQPAATRHAPEFRVAIQNGSLAWAADDFKETNSIRRLAHNDLEYERMVEENARIFRRQLVFWKETPDAVLQKAKVNGESVNQLTLPALDGKRVQFQITGRDVHPSGLEGMFRGHLMGRPESFVTLAFYQGRQAFTIISPQENLFLEGEAHEPGDVVVKELNPAIYFAGVCGVK